MGGRARRLTSLRQSWDTLGNLDPMWAILTNDPDKLGNGWDPKEFFATGVGEIQELFDGFKRNHIEIHNGKALDFGCGIGRLTQALGASFDHVTGVDIASSMITNAQAINRLGERCTYVLNEASNLSVFPDDEFDLVYSVQVLQHMHPELAEHYIAEFIRVTANGGVIVFQLPEPVPKKLLARVMHFAMPALLWAAPARLLHSYRRFKYKNAPAALIEALPAKGLMEMHGISPSRVRRLVEKAAGTVLAVEKYRPPDVTEVFSNWCYYIKK